MGRGGVGEQRVVREGLAGEGLDGGVGGGVRLDLGDHGLVAGDEAGEGSLGEVAVLGPDLAAETDDQALQATEVHAGGLSLSTTGEFEDRR